MPSPVPRVRSTLLVSEKGPNMRKMILWYSYTVVPYTIMPHMLLFIALNLDGWIVRLSYFMAFMIRLVKIS